MNAPELTVEERHAVYLLNGYGIVVEEHGRESDELYDVTVFARDRSGRVRFGNLARLVLEVADFVAPGRLPELSDLECSEIVSVYFAPHLPD